MKILIAGLGSIGRRHLRNLQALGVDDFILYRTRQSTLPDDALKDLPTETELSSALAHHPDAVVISNPTAMHMDIALPAVQAGCHLFIEKPISHNLEQVPALQQAAERSGAQVLVGFQFRFHEGLRSIYRLLQEGKLGKPVSARAHYGEYLPAWHPWEDYRQSYSARSDLGGGVVLTLSHPLDYLRWLLGEVDALWAFTGQQAGLGIDVEDTAEIGLHFASGVIASVHLDYIQQPGAHWLEIIGTQGRVRWDYYQNALWVWLGQEAQPVQIFDQEDIRNPMFLAEMNHFLAVIQQEETPLCTLQDGIQDLKIALAAYRSAKCGELIQLS